MSVFDIIGPIMTGPSSSHTAGVVKIGALARKIFKDQPETIEIYFHGSFAHTYQGHGTDRAIIAGILGMRLDDNKIKKSLKIAQEKGINIKFASLNLHGVHPNTLKIILKKDNEKMSIIASSTGGGEIIISQINDYEVDFKGKFPTLWLLHNDKPGELAAITSVLAEHKINIAFMKVFRENKGGLASSIIELDQKVESDILDILSRRKNIKKILFVPSLF